MEQRKHYYVFQKDYYQLKAFSGMLKNSEISDETLVNYLEKNNLNVNSYITTFDKKDTFVPIIYQCSMLPNREILFKYLIKKRATLDKLPDANDDTINYNILFVCHEKYLSFISKNVSITKDKENQLKNKLLFGNYRRVLLLKKRNIVKESDISLAFNDSDFLLKCIKLLIDRICLIFRTHNSQEEADKVISKYQIIFKLYKKYGGSEPSDKIIQALANYYQHKLLTTLFILYPLLKKKLENIEVKYHTDASMKPEIVAILRRLYNDRNYVLTCDILDKIPISDAY